MYTMCPPGYMVVLELVLLNDQTIFQATPKQQEHPTFFLGVPPGGNFLSVTYTIEN